MMKCHNRSPMKLYENMQMHVMVQVITLGLDEKESVLKNEGDHLAKNNL